MPRTKRKTYNPSTDLHVEVHLDINGQYKVGVENFATSNHAEAMATARKLAETLGGVPVREWASTFD